MSWRHRFGACFLLVHLAAVAPVFGEGGHGDGSGATPDAAPPLTERPGLTEDQKKDLLEKVKNATNQSDLTPEEWAQAVDLYNEMAVRTDLTAEQKIQLANLAKQIREVGNLTARSTTPPTGDGNTGTFKSRIENILGNNTAATTTNPTTTKDPFANFQNAFSQQEVKNEMRDPQARRASSDDASTHPNSAPDPLNPFLRFTSLPGPTQTPPEQTAKPMPPRSKNTGEPDAGGVETFDPAPDPAPWTPFPASPPHSRPPLNDLGAANAAKASDLTESTLAAAANENVGTAWVNPPPPPPDPVPSGKGAWNPPVINEPQETAPTKFDSDPAPPAETQAPVSADASPLSKEAYIVMSYAAPSAVKIPPLPSWEPGDASVKPAGVKASSMERSLERNSDSDQGNESNSEGNSSSAWRIIKTYGGVADAE
jgi:hypothetical protein